MLERAIESAVSGVARWTWRRWWPSSTRRRGAPARRDSRSRDERVLTERTASRRSSDERVRRDDERSRSPCRTRGPRRSRRSRSAGARAAARRHAAARACAPSSSSSAAKQLGTVGAGRRRRSKRSRPTSFDGDIALRLDDRPDEESRARRCGPPGTSTRCASGGRRRDGDGAGEACAEHARTAANGNALRRRRQRARRGAAAAHVRIDLRRLDTLMNLIGELVITRGRLAAARRRRSTIRRSPRRSRRRRASWPTCRTGS